MEILTALVSAIALGASEGVKSAASQAVVEAYKAVKSHLLARYASVDVAQLERNPQSSARRALLAEELNQVGAAKDSELLSKIDRLLNSAARCPSGSSDAVILRDIESAQEVVIENIRSSGGGIVGETWRVGGSIRISGVNSTGHGSSDEQVRPKKTEGQQGG